MHRKRLPYLQLKQMEKKRFYLLSNIGKVVLLYAIMASCQSEQPIDRKTLVQRHNIKVNSFDPYSSLSVGNGEFAFTVDATGLQTFPELYENGVPLGTQSQWGWHSFPNDKGYRFEETLKEYDFGRGHQESYSVQIKTPEHAKEACDYFRVNPHRLHLGNIGLELTQADGTPATPQDLSSIHEEIDLWTGKVHASFVFENEPVKVTTFAHPQKDGISTRIESPLIAKGQLKIRLKFPYPTGKHSDNASDWTQPEKHQTKLKEVNKQSAILCRTLDTTTYSVQLLWEGKATLQEKEKHYFVLEPQSSEKAIEFNCFFSPLAAPMEIPSYTQTQDSSINKWTNYWTQGAAVDFSGSTDPRATELERRIVLSQYLMAIQCAGSLPPQETGLTYNSWFGKFHLEMIWWHQVHFALWNHAEMIKPALQWYKEIAYNEAQQIASRQNFKGIRWMKMTDPAAKESPSSVGSLLIWQQPHIIYLAELCYRNEGREILDEYKDLVFETADFMADFVVYEKDKDRYSLNHVNGAQETLKPDNSHNPPFEVAYWHWGLKTAQEWRDRMGMDRNPLWDDIINKLPAFTEKDGKYLAAESLPDTYTNERYMSDHPMVLAPYGFLPPVDRMGNKEIMKNTFDFIYDNWFWNHTWGWDYPLAAMTAVRLGLPDKAIDLLLMDKQKNTYLPNGHNYQDSRLRVYLPGNGGLLTTVAMMCAGYDGCDEKNPGIPKDGHWKVRWEGLQKMP